MATASVAIRDSSPRYHQHCDNCGAEANGVAGNAVRSETETAACSFKYQLCLKCARAFGKKATLARQRAVIRAKVRHAAHYSEGFGAFVASWYGVPFSGSQAEGH